MPVTTTVIIMRVAIEPNLCLRRMPITMYNDNDIDNDNDNDNDNKFSLLS